MISWKDFLLTNDIEKMPFATLIAYIDAREKDLLLQLEEQQSNCTKIIFDRDNKIESLIKEKNAYQQLYLDSKDEAKSLRTANNCYQTISILSKQLKEAHDEQDYLESQNLKLKETIKTLESQRDSYRKLAESFADICRPASIDLSAHVKAPSNSKVENLNGKLTLIDKGYYKLLVLSDDKVEMTILGNVEYNYTLGDFTLKEFDTYYCVFKLGSVPFMKINKFTREVTRL